ncbi:MAG: class II fumarate hydratase [Myxococcales bacterium]|nr:class II fumarate hydratase [Myxococcales bacterium]
MGAIEVADDALWGAQTQRALENFGRAAERMPAAIVRAYGMLKRAAAEANQALGLLPPDVAGWIARASEEVARGEHAADFPLSIWQTGSGTQTHMNVNEVVANRANELAGAPRGAKAPVHPNDHVNLGQSTNDTFPTAMHVAAALAVRDALDPALDALLATLDALAARHAGLVKLGRTHLQDATPLTLGQEIGGWAAQVRTARRAIAAALPLVHELAIGGTAVGTGLNAHERFGDEVARRLGERTGLPLRTAPDRFAALAGREATTALMGALATLAGALLKVANDVRWLSSGPRSGLGELRIPANEPGSSIMPGKVNPTQAEALAMACLHVLGSQTSVAIAGSQGNFELNVCAPLIAHHVLQAIDVLAATVAHFEAHCLRGLEPVPERIREHLERSLMLVTALAPHTGYDAAARIAKKAHEEGLTLREAALALGEVTGEEFDRWVRPERMTRPGREG